MAERVQERDPSGINLYHEFLARLEKRQDDAENGQIVMKGSELPWQLGRQGRVKFYLYAVGRDQTAIKDWLVFVNDIHTHTGKHIHQGGLGLYILRGRGYTVVNGERFNWKEGDLVILPVMPGGCEHQHFNEDPDESSLWLAIIYEPFMYVTGSQLEQREVHPDWKEA
ncbi:cupin domain-containing protein [Dactylosporangium fulvum]|uniref:Cupin domain-containing protein n=1 Tax=Dactylosporangium fulvum TaxID=53359 RepID=A0ABY5VR28_9ACTN|nr:cupin domain-containing protein [Dactylosporangium fulvum]UWP80237.1 cupin domain-containing protein [Dactylosporangium fulvum]